jgi:hypothetical protein
MRNSSSNICALWKRGEKREKEKERKRREGKKRERKRRERKREKEKRGEEKRKKKNVQVRYIIRYLCDPFSRAPHRRFGFGRWDAEEGHIDPS